MWAHRAERNGVWRTADDAVQASAGMEASDFGSDEADDKSVASSASSARPSTAGSLVSSKRPLA